MKQIISHYNLFSNKAKTLYMKRKNRKALSLYEKSIKLKLFIYGELSLESARDYFYFGKNLLFTSYDFIDYPAWDNIIISQLILSKSTNPKSDLCYIRNYIFFDNIHKKNKDFKAYKLLEYIQCIESEKLLINEFEPGPNSSGSLTNYYEYYINVLISVDKYLLALLKKDFYTEKNPYKFKAYENELFLLGIKTITESLWLDYTLVENKKNKKKYIWFQKLSELLINLQKETILLKTQRKRISFYIVKTKNFKLQLQKRH